MSREALLRWGSRLSLAPKMQIAHVFPSLSYGGAEIYMLDLAEAQMRAGLTVSVWVAAGSRLEKEARRRKLHVFTDPVSLRLNVSGLFGLAQVIRREGLTHLHFHWSGGPWAFWGIKRLVKIRLILHIHMWMKHSKKDPLHWAVYRSLDRVIVAGERLKQASLRCLPIAASKYRIVEYAIPEVAQVTPVDFFEKGLFVFGLFARIDRQKGQKEFLLALQKLVTEGLPVAGLLVGDPTHGEKDAEAYRQEVQALVESPALRGRVLQKPFSQDYLSWLAGCQVLVAPSYHECYSLILLHAYSVGVPVLSTNSGGTPDLVPPERGWLVPPQNISALCDQMREIVTSAGAAEKKGTVAQAQIRSAHSFSSVLKKLEDVY